MFIKKCVLPFVFTLLISYGANAVDYTGTYYGIKCKNNPQCVDGERGKGLLDDLLNFGGNNKDTRIAILVTHDKVKNAVSIFLPDYDYMFKDMILKGDGFSGFDDNTGNHKITVGNFIGPVIKITLNRFHNSDTEKTFYYKGTLTKSDIILREKLDEIIVKDKIINNLENNVSDLETDITQLKKTIEDGIVEITNLNKEIDILKKKIQDTITIKNKETDVIESTYQNKIDTLKKEQDKKKTSLLEEIEKCIEKPIRIDASFINMRSAINQETALYTAPSDKSSVVETLQDGTKIESLKLVGDKKSWSLVVTETGLIGYIFSDYINTFGGDDPTPPPTPGDEKIAITLPEWDAGFKNQVMTVESGFISILGRVNIESGILEIQLNESLCNPPENDGSFECFYIIEDGDNDITIKVIDRNNEIHELSFIIKGN